MIIGIGTDIIEIERIRSTIEKYGERLKEKTKIKNETTPKCRPINNARHYAFGYCSRAGYGFLYHLPVLVSGVGTCLGGFRMSV